MKAEELMIGDWVHFKNDLGEEWDGQFSVLDFTTGNFLNCKPIPLTAEGLESNSFLHHTPHCWIYEDLEERIYIRYYQSGGEPSATMEICKNVDTEDEVTYELPEPYFFHELQHYLRDCGLTELANSLKPIVKQEN